jgi:hypothetical protein
LYHFVPTAIRSGGTHWKFTFRRRRTKGKLYPQRCRNDSQQRHCES